MYLIFHLRSLFLLAGFMSYSAFACVNLGTWNLYIPFGNVVVQRDVPVGTQIASAVVHPTNEIISDCKNGGQQYEKMNTGPLTAINNVYETGIPGVGIKGEPWQGYYGFFTNPAVMQSFPANNYPEDTAPHNFYLVKTGPIQSGVFDDRLIASVYYDTGGNALQFYITNSKVTQILCSVTTPNLTFPIGDVLASTFSNSVGTIPAGAQNTQSLGLNCDAGANINVMLQGTQNPDVSTTSVLALTGQGNSDVAKGVGVQLLYNGIPLALNNRIVLKQSAGGQETFPITARYYQTKTSVSTGKANASATLDLTYQ